MYKIPIRFPHFFDLRFFAFVHFYRTEAEVNKKSVPVRITLFLSSSHHEFLGNLSFLTERFDLRNPRPAVSQR